MQRQVAGKVLFLFYSELLGYWISYRETWQTPVTTAGMLFLGNVTVEYEQPANKFWNDYFKNLSFLDGQANCLKLKAKMIR